MHYTNYIDSAERAKNYKFKIARINQAKKQYLTLLSVWKEMKQRCNKSKTTRTYMARLSRTI